MSTTKKYAAIIIAMLALPAAGMAQSSPLAPEAQKPPLLEEKTVAALAAELSGETAKRNLEGISRQHRVRGSRPLRTAGEIIAERAKAYGLEEVKIEEFPADGKIFYGTQRSRPPWDAEFAEMWEMKQENGKWVPAVRWGDWDSQPLTLAEDSESADVTAELVDVGNGTAESDYAGKGVKGKLVLAAAQADAVARLAVGKFGAAGIVSYAQNQRTAWWGEDENLIRWGHLETFAPYKTFAFMISLKTARGFRERLAHGEKIMMHAVVKAGQHAGAYTIPTAAILGADPKLREEEIVFSCHLDHPRPGANDNASGCVTILEVARTLAKLIAEGKIARPARTIRFVWPPEVEGTMALLNAKPEWARRIKAAIHMDMVGGGLETKAVFHVTRGPMSLPSFIYDVAEAFGEFVNEQSLQFASTGQALYPLVAPEGGKEPLLAQMSEFSMGSDHEVYMDSSWRIPAIYLNDWPDRYIHTNFDVPANIDPTKLKRAAFIGAASGYFLADFRDSGDVIRLYVRVIRGRIFRRTAILLEKMPLFEDGGDHARAFRNSARVLADCENQVISSISSFSPLPAVMKESFKNVISDLQAKLTVPDLHDEDKPGPSGLLLFRRTAAPKGPLSIFGYDYFTDKYGEDKARKLKLPNFSGLRGSGEEYAYEVLNFVDGVRNAQQIRDAVSAEYGPVPLEYVVEYLQALESIDVVRRVM